MSHIAEEVLVNTKVIYYCGCGGEWGRGAPTLKPPVGDQQGEAVDESKKEEPTLLRLRRVAVLIHTSPWPVAGIAYPYRYLTSLILGKMGLLDRATISIEIPSDDVILSGIGVTGCRRGGKQEGLFYTIKSRYSPLERDFRSWGEVSSRNPDEWGKTPIGGSKVPIH